MTAHYALAHDRYYASFFERHPHILENFLINAIIRRRFPFGPEGIVEGAPASMTREFAMLTAQFALMKGLLIATGKGFQLNMSYTRYRPPASISNITRSF